MTLEELREAARLDHAAGPERVRIRAAAVLMLFEVHDSLLYEFKQVAGLLEDLRATHAKLRLERDVLNERLEDLMYGHQHADQTTGLRRRHG